MKTIGTVTVSLSVTGNERSRTLHVVLDNQMVDERCQHDQMLEETSLSISQVINRVVDRGWQWCSFCKTDTVGAQLEEIIGRSV